MEGVARRWEEMGLTQLGLMVRSSRKGGRLIGEDVIAIEERDAACFQLKVVVRRYCSKGERREVGISAIECLARFADPRLHVIFH